MKIKTYIFFAGLLVLLFLLCSVLSFSRPLDLSRLNFAQRYVLNGINKKWETYCRSLPEEQRSQIDFGTMMRLLGPVQRDLALKILSVDPTALGSRAPFISVKTAKDLVRLENTTFEAAATGAATGETGIEYLPEHVYLDYKKLAGAMKKDINEIVFVDSGYRPAGRQLLLFFHYLAEENRYSLKENSKWVALPGHSQHNDPVNTAVDFITQKGIGDGSFEATAQYRWLQKNAAKFNFRLSYPKDNPYGFSFEPWHWRWAR